MQFLFYFSRYGPEEETRGAPQCVIVAEYIFWRFFKNFDEIFSKSWFFDKFAPKLYPTIRFATMFVNKLNLAKVSKPRRNRFGIKLKSVIWIRSGWQFLCFGPKLYFLALLFEQISHITCWRECVNLHHLILPTHGPIVFFIETAYSYATQPKHAYSLD